MVDFHLGRLGGSRLLVRRCRTASNNLMSDAGTAATTEEVLANMSCIRKGSLQETIRFSIYYQGYHPRWHPDISSPAWRHGDLPSLDQSIAHGLPVGSEMALGISVGSEIVFFRAPPPRSLT